MNNLKELTNNLKREELIELKKEVISGDLDKLINKKLSQEFLHSKKRCPVCGETITKEPYILEFGNLIRRKAHFDGKDCLTYFVVNKIHEKNL